ncbi:hypothetical protein JQ615_21250 [Bradyrhizobium jicamae]|uniref:HipA N-terminal subdomain 1 domain-containing protein n=1 Tax=Bradyrhizobium jicamae TaxID=280332 RepID=A0ABS5FMP1_9BRAD|nr:hypothetical protein [Bradyrhizobium jicamae]MBR0797919.1 hypothetical protein [Bradyrhizobium jicamae]MBR0931933.1 hypothetical protein [Bradyrhizobium jicamae]
MSSSLEISDDILWGKLVKSWATGKNYIASTRPAPPIPRTLDELLAQAAEIGLTITFPDGMVGLEIIQYSGETAVIKLPPKSMIEATETELRTPGALYPMPQFYEDFFGAPVPTMDQASLLDLHAARIGDYSVRNCG